jgi:DNA invertase Pin-like site-specific DNA recombinase
MLGIYVRTSSENDQRESPIEQQKEEGVKFAKENKYEFKIYEDKGISGYTISEDDETKPYDNRPSFVELMEDIRKKDVDMVWVWEHSRFSRNAYASAHIFHDFEKFKIKIFVKDKEYNISDPQIKAHLGFMNIMSELERESIVARTTRGRRKKINEGKRSFGKLYGYKKIGVDPVTRHQKIEKIDSEIENIKYAYKRILEGSTLRQLTLELYNKKAFDKNEALRVSRYWHKILCHFSYTGYELNVAGLEIRKKFDNFETDNLSVLNDSVYYTRSANYREKIISVEKWIKVAERLRINRKIRNDSSNKKASKDLGTGIIKCAECGQKYYSYIHDNKKGGKRYSYNYYKHYMAMNRKIHDCHQKKSFIAHNINEMLKIFYFFNYIMFDKTKEQNEETLRLIKQEQLKANEEMAKCEREIAQFDKSIIKFNKVMDETDEVELIKGLMKRINNDEAKRNEAKGHLGELRIELEKLNIKYAGTETENMYYNVKDRINQFFKKLDVEDQRDELIKTIKECMVMETCIVIDSGANLFIFNTEETYTFDASLLKKLDDDRYFKISYLGQNKNIDIEALMKEDKELLRDIIKTDDNIRNFGKVIMRPVYLESKEYDMKGYVRDIFRENYIEYSLEGKTNVIFFHEKE